MDVRNRARARYTLWEMKRTGQQNRRIAGDKEWCEIKSRWIRVMYMPNSHSDVSFHCQTWLTPWSGSVSQGWILPHHCSSHSSARRPEKYDMLLFNMMYYSSQGSSLCLQAVLMLFIYIYIEMGPRTFGRCSKFQLIMRGDKLLWKYSTVEQSRIKWKQIAW